ncbi:MAG: acyl-CoA dehydrogenase family protein [Novosphingobium sp.]
MDEFRIAVREWLAENFPPGLRGCRAPTNGHEPPVGPPEEFGLWRQRFAQAGFGAPTWAREYGGAELSPAQAEALAEEIAKAGAFNPIVGLGLWMLGPTLLEFGTEEQKRTHLPPIARGELLWCQGFSEPGAGSDLAALRMRCEDKGDHWLLNGQKVWTSYAHHSDWCFALARTSTEQKQGGISFLLVDMKTPGVEARPIKLINGVSHFCETFFTDVKVPKENLVGEVNGGWTIAKRLLQHERTGLSSLRGANTQTYDLSDLARRYRGTDAQGRIVDADLRHRLADHLLGEHAYRLTLARRTAELEAGLEPTTPVSTLKNLGSQVGLELGELAIEILSNKSLGWEGEGYTEEELELTSLWLHSKCYTIYGGSYEIQNNITARRELGLPAS